MNRLNPYFAEKNENPLESWARAPQIILDFDGDAFRSVRGSPEIILKIDSADSWVTLSNVEDDLEKLIFYIITI